MRLWKIVISLLIFSSIVFAGNRHRLELFVMSKCPYGIRAETQIFNLVSQHKDILDKIDVEIHYILDYDSASESFHSLHGQKEVDEDIRQIIINKYFPDKFWCYLMSRNSHIQDTLWEKDAKMCDINVKKLVKYVKKKGYTLALLEAHLTDSLDINASPTMLLDGVKIRDWQGDFPTLYTILKNSFVEKASKMKCEENIECPPRIGYISTCINERCQYKKAPLVKLTVIALDTTRYGNSSFGLVRFLKSETGNLETVYIPYGDEKSKEFLEKLNNARHTKYQAKSAHYAVSKGEEEPVTEINSLPVYVISYNINQYPSFKHFSSYLMPSELDGDSVYIVKPNTYSAKGLLNREEEKGKVDIFVMSKCPFSHALVESLLSKDFGGLDMDSITLHYVIGYDESTGKFDSYHGRPELLEDKRQLIIQKYFNSKLWDYINCYNLSQKSDSCLTSLGIKPNEVNRKIRKYADNMLKDDYNLSKDLNITSTPTVLLENRYLLRNSDDIQKYFNIVLKSGQCGK